MQLKQDFYRNPAYLNKDITSVNRNSAHSPWLALPTKESALRGEASPYRVSLNGEYDFYCYESPDQVDNFYEPGYNTTGAKKIQVPGNWETQGFDEPIYTNVLFPWNYDMEEPCNIKPGKGLLKIPNAPHIPSHNPTGCYRRSFTVPKSFAGREVYLYFEGVETAYYLWVNGQPVGYSEDSKLPSEFNITPYLQEGENLLALQVMRFATSTYMEDQDYWYLSGIYRNVWLVAKPKIAIEDYKVRAIPDLNHLSGTVSADITVTRREGYADCSVGLALYDGETLLAEGQGSIAAVARYRTAEQPTANTGRVSLTIPKIALWSPESPKLYTLVVTLLDQDGNLLDTETCRTGFKKVEVKNGVVLLNGQRLIIRGVNRHEHCPKGRAVSREHMEEEIRQMKRMHINSVRTCHYPDAPLWYDLCDEYGILLICECNLETHGVEGQLSHNPDYAMSYLERATRMVCTHKNHVSIYSWSLGNESGHGANHAAMYGFIKEYDKDRLCQFESGEPGKNISDVRGNMYAPVHQILKMLADVEDDRPIILVEYLYQISNSGGGLKKFRELTEKYPRFQGGYVWDWQDKGLLAKAEDGTEFFGFGGDFGESYVEHDCPPFMTNNGIVLPDLTWKPVAYELKAAYAPVLVERPEILSPWQSRKVGAEYIVKNNTDTEYLREYRCRVLLKENGLVIAEQELELPNLPPRSQKAITVDLPYQGKPGCEYYLDFEIIRRAAAWYEDAGDIVSATQFRLLGESFRYEEPKAVAAVFCEDAGEELLLQGEGFCYRFLKNTGEVCSAVKDGVEYLQRAMVPSFLRPITGIDCQPGWGSFEQYQIFEQSRYDCEYAGAMTGEGSASLEFRFQVHQEDMELVMGTLRYTVFGGGQLKTEYFATVFPVLVSRVGLELTIPAGFESVSYYGYGENENYCDRMESVRLGVYHSTVEEQHFPFSPISETGGHEGTRWLKLSDAEGHSMKLTANMPFHFDVHHNTVADYRVAKHDHELVRRKEAYLHIDAAHSQIGSEMAWSTQLDDSMHIGGKSHYLSFLTELF